MTNEAHTTLSYFGIHNAKLQALPSISNQVWQVQSNQERFVLRISPATNCFTERLETESRWLRAILEETDLSVSIPVSTLRGNYFLITNQSNCASLYRWLPGETLTTAHLDTQTLQEIGHFVAKLHSQSAQFRPSPPLKPASLLAHNLFGPNSPYHSQDTPNSASVLTEETRAVIAAVADRFTKSLSPLDVDPAATGMIHGDLVAKNWLRSPNGLALIDFDHCGWGYFIYDLAALCIQLLDEADFPERRAALIAGYTKTRPIPPNAGELLDISIVARYAASCLWLARESRKPTFAATAKTALSFRTDQMERYLESGQLPRRGALF